MTWVCKRLTEVLASDSTLRDEQAATRQILTGNSVDKSPRHITIVQQNQNLTRPARDRDYLLDVNVIAGPIAESIFVLWVRVCQLIVELLDRYIESLELIDLVNYFAVDPRWQDGGSVKGNAVLVVGDEVPKGSLGQRLGLGTE